jgi:hypothetical protein
MPDELRLVVYPNCWICQKQVAKVTIYGDQLKTLTASEIKMLQPEDFVCEECEKLL